jgi:hypothetical protein
MQQDRPRARLHFKISEGGDGRNVLCYFVLFLLCVLCFMLLFWHPNIAGNPFKDGIVWGIEIAGKGTGSSNAYQVLFLDIRLNLFDN